MTTDEIRSRWPSLSARERDAEVAETLGHVLSDPALFRANRYIVQEPRTEHETILLVPQYTEKWEHAGPLFEEMLAAGNELEFTHWPDRVIVKPETSAYFAARGETWPEVIALAYVLWKSQEKKS